MRKTKYKIEDLRAHAVSKGGKCLSDVYIGCAKKYDWECEHGHRWSSAWYGVKNNGNWCKQCSHPTQTIEMLHDYAKLKGGKCLSTEYVGMSDHHDWECEHGHRWGSFWGNMKFKQSWCPVCAGCAKPDISELHEYAESKGGKCLSTEYINNHTGYEWECKRGHRWTAPWANKKRFNSWCIKCYRDIIDISNYGYTPDKLDCAIIQFERRQFSSLATCIKKKYKICQVTGKPLKSGKQVLHHILSFRKYPELRFKWSNFILVDFQIHKEFHLLYGNYDFTKEDWLEYVKEVQSDIPQEQLDKIVFFDEE